MPPEERDIATWPNWPMVLRTSSSHEEGCDRKWAVNTKAFLGDREGALRALQIVQVEWAREEESGRYSFREVPGTEQELPCELALIAAGFLHPQHEGMLEKLGLKLTDRGNVSDNRYQTSLAKVFVAGDMRRGQSLVVWAISEGREAAKAVDCYLMGESLLEGKEDPLMKMA